jgi:hypothetical protein
MNWNGRVSLALATVAALFGITVAPTADAQQKKPNVVYFLVDNLGIGELSVYSGGPLRGTYTPHIDTFAAVACGAGSHDVLRLDLRSPEATCRCIESGPSLMLRLSPRRKRKTIALMPTRFAMVCGEIFCRESLRGRHHRPAIAGETLS